MNIGQHCCLLRKKENGHDNFRPSDIALECLLQKKKKQINKINETKRNKLKPKNNDLSPVNDVDHCFSHFAIFVTSLI